MKINNPRRFDSWIIIDLDERFKNLETKTNRQLVIHKMLSNSAIRTCKYPFDLKKVSALIRNLMLVSQIDAIQTARNKMAVVAFYSCPPDLRGKKLNKFISDFYDLVYPYVKS